MTINRDTADWGQYKPQRRNLLINGGFQIWQKGTSFSPAVQGTSHTDMWQWTQIGTAVFDWNQEVLLGTGSPMLEGSDGPDAQYAIRVDVTTADASVAAGDIWEIKQNIEGMNIGHLRMGTSGAKTVTLSFWHAHTKTGTNCCALRNGAGDRSYIIEYTQSVADTWEYHEETITLDTTGDWLSGQDEVGLRLGFAMGVGTTRQTAAGSWTAGNYTGSSNQVNNADSTANSFRLAAIKLEVGSDATDYEEQEFTQELLKCQRYYEKSYNYTTVPGAASPDAGAGLVQWQTRTAIAATTAGTLRTSVSWNTTKRGTPTVTIYAYDGTEDAVRLQGGVTNRTGVTVTAAGGQGFAGMNVSNASSNVISLDDIIDFHWTADAEL